MKKSVEEILEKIEDNWNKRQGWAWRIRNKIVYNFMRNLYDKGTTKTIPDPAIDEENETFSFYAKPSMQLGFPGEEQATRVDYDGQLDTGNGKFLFLTGDPLEPVQERIWTLTKGYLPEINYSIIKNDVQLSFRVFQFWIDDKILKQVPINFIQVDIENRLDKENELTLYFGVLFSLFKVYRIMIKHARFNKSWTYQFDNGTKAYRAHKLLYLADKNQNPTALYSKIVLDKKTGKQKLIPYNESFKGSKQKIKKDTITLTQEYKLNLSAKEKKTLIFKVPHYPIDFIHENTIEKIENADINNYREKFEQFWDDILAKCMSIEVPEEKVTNTHKASLIYNFMCQNFHKEGTIEQHVNRFQYNAFWIRDSSFYSKMYASFNRPDISRRLLLHFLTKQDKDGNFCSQSGQLDGWGQSLWAFGEYLKLTGDEAFAKIIFNPMMRAIKYLQKIINKDKWGIMPPRFAADNEMISGRYTGHNLWAWCGLNSAIWVADFLNKTNEKMKISKLKEQFLGRFLPIFNKICEHHHNRVPPGLDTDIGEDWSNLLLLYPQKLLELDDPKIKTTLDDYRKNKMPEGIAMWMIFLHHYITERIAQQNLILDNQELVLRDLYSMLSHTGACHGGFEHNIKPWGNRHYLIPIRVLFLKMDYFNYPQHGWFAVAYNLLLRNMLIREEDNDLHLLSAIAPEWINGNISIKNANTYFGVCNLKLTKEDSQLQLIVNINFERKKLDNIIIHIPYFIDKNSLKLESNIDYKLNNSKSSIILKPKEEILIKINWKINEDTDLSYLSYEKAVNWLKSEYKKMYLTNRSS